LATAIILVGTGGLNPKTAVAERKKEQRNHHQGMTLFRRPTKGNLDMFEDYKTTNKIKIEENGRACSGDF
jgi:hypothetical protein